MAPVLPNLGMGSSPQQEKVTFQVRRYQDQDDKPYSSRLDQRWGRPEWTAPNLDTALHAAARGIKDEIVKSEVTVYDRGPVCVRCVLLVAIA